MQNFRPAMIGEMIVSNDPDDVLVVYGIGSCVVVCLYDPIMRMGGILHALLPTTPDFTLDKPKYLEDIGDSNIYGNLAKFVDKAIPILIDSLEAQGASPFRLVAQLCGGARILTAPGFKDSLNIGERNIIAAKTALQTAGITIKAEAIGGYTGRTVKLYIANGQVTVKTLGQEEQELRSAKCQKF